MTQFKMKQLDAARATLAAGAELAREKVPSRDGVNWNDRRTGYFLMNEANGLIQKISSAVDMSR